MKNLLIIILLLPLFSKAQLGIMPGVAYTGGVPPSPITFIGEVGAGTVSGDGITTGTMNTTGATLIIVAAVSYFSSATPILTDSQGNTWTQLSAYTNGTVRITMYYTYTPNVNASHTFTYTRTAGYMSIIALAFGGTTGSFDTENGTAGGSSPVSTGTVTPATNGQLIVAAIGLTTTSGTPTVTSGFTNYFINHNGSTAFGISVAYYMQSTAASQGCTFAFTGGASASGAIATFK